MDMPQIKPHSFHSTQGTMGHKLKIEPKYKRTHAKQLINIALRHNFGKIPTWAIKNPSWVPDGHPEIPTKNTIEIRMREMHHLKSLEAGESEFDPFPQSIRPVPVQFEHVPSPRWRLIRRGIHGEVKR